MLRVLQALSPLSLLRIKMKPLEFKTTDLALVVMAASVLSLDFGHMALMMICKEEKESVARGGCATSPPRSAVSEMQPPSAKKPPKNPATNAARAASSASSVPAAHIAINIPEGMMRHRAPSEHHITLPLNSLPASTTASTLQARCFLYPGMDLVYPWNRTLLIRTVRFRRWPSSSRR